jgi:spore maturation protein CgeB
MQRHLRNLLNDSALASSLAANGLETIHKRHTCSHRVDELFRIYATVRPCATRVLENASLEEVHA